MIDQNNNEYNLMLPVWSKNRKAESGNTAIKGAGKTYLPIMNGHNDNDYEHYKQRALYYNFVGRTTTGLKGTVFRKEPVVTLPDSMSTYIEGVTQSGETLTGFMQKVVKEVINPSRVGILIDYPSQSTENMSISDVEQSNIKPYVSMYVAESIINWREEVVKNKNVLTMAVIKEVIEKENANDKYKNDTINQYRVLELIEGAYTVSVYQANGKSEPSLIESVTPRVNGATLDYIPFYIINQNGISNNITSKPVVDDLTDINIAHYVNSADYENALHWSGVRTVIVSGWPEDKALELGKAMAIPEGAKAYFLVAPTDDALTKGMSEKERIMVSLGANLITSQANATTATSSLIQHQGEVSVITDIANNVSNVMTTVMRTVAEWIGASDKEKDSVSVKLNVDFNPLKMTGQDALAMVSVWQQGGIDKNTLYYNYRKGELIPETTSNADLDENIKAEQAERESNLLNVPQFE